MKKLLLIIFVLSFSFIHNQINAQAPDWLFAYSAGGFEEDSGQNITTDSNGNVYVTGYFGPSISFGSVTLINTSSGYSDIFIVKYDNTGNVIWAKKAGGNYSDGSYDIATDGNGNVYVTGSFMSSSINFGSTILTNNSSSITFDIFLAKYDTNGNVIWAKKAGGTNHDESYSIAVDASGNAYITGHFRGSYAFFDSDTLTNNGSASTSDIFVAKYDSNGNELWAKRSGGTGSEVGQSIATDNNGNVYVTGLFNSSSIVFGSTTLTNAGGYDIFLAKYDSNGNELWAKRAGGIDWEQANGIAIDGSGNIYITGGFKTSPITFGSNTLISNGNYDIYVTKYDNNGNVIWAKSAGGTGIDNGNNIEIDNFGNVFITGTFGSSSISFGSSTLITGGSYDIFIAKYDNNGNELWAKSAGGSDWDLGKGIAIDEDGNNYITGDFQSTSISFGSTTFINTNTSMNTADMFVAKLNSTYGIKENEFEDNVNIYPNPTTGIFTISAEEMKINKIKVMNVLGEIIKNEELGIRNDVSFDMSGFGNGIYFVSIETEKGVINKKIIINNN